MTGRAKVRHEQLPLCEEPDHEPELRRRRATTRQCGAGKQTFQDAVHARRLAAEAAMHENSAVHDHEQ
jgi:hypothetical protein